MNRTIRIATRKSQLALWQAHYVKSELEKLDSGLKVELLGMTSRGDKILDAPLAKVGGKGLFVKELEESLLSEQADIAVHSMKDVPMDLPAGLCLTAICPREKPTDAFVSNQYTSVAELPEGAVVGTSSLRREAQLRERRPDLNIKWLRGNVNTRLQKLDNGEYDAIILATAGLIRLEMEARISSEISVEDSLPAGGQGAVGIECRESDQQLIDLLASLHDPKTACCVNAERAMNRRLEGGCQVPIACFATLNQEQTELKLRGLVAQADGSLVLRAEEIGQPDSAEVIGIKLADRLIDAGAKNILDSIYAQS